MNRLNSVSCTKHIIGKAILKANNKNNVFSWRKYIIY